jgi:DNA invertase Pin-like site-specific DNA recombinase
MLVGYGRTSTTDQEAGMEAQERDLSAAGCDKLFIEQVSSVGKRQQLDAALDYVREGDTLVVTKLDRLARSVPDPLPMVARLEGKNVALRVLAMSGGQPLDTGTAIGKLMLAVIGAVGQFEREMMLERQREGIAKAKRDGRYKGRAPTVRRQAADIIRLKHSGVTPTEIASRLGLAGRASIGFSADSTTGRTRWPDAPSGRATLGAHITDQQSRLAMAIGSAVEGGSLIYVYDERGMMLFTKARGSGPNDGLLGFTGATVTMRSGSVVYTYNEKGMMLYTKGA